jgi:GH15 family glucan-1,4-alpha-glucosidase
MPLRVEDYAVIGDCETAALVGTNGSIDWLCWPDFAAAACFAALLGDEDNGHWQIAPARANSPSDTLETPDAGSADGEEDGTGFASKGKWTVTRRYAEESMVLETTFTLDGNSVRISDFMPVRSGHSHLVRVVDGLHGTVRMRMEFAVRFGYGRIVPWVTREENGIKCVAGPNMVVLRSSVPTHGVGRKTIANFSIRAGERLAFTLSYGDSAGSRPTPIDADKTLDKATQMWSRWAAKSTRAGKYTDAVRRSLLVLKALTFRPTGGVAAAVTTSLPEALGGPRNWDYRYCWLRDSTFTLLAMMNGNYYREAEAWGDWLLRAIAGSPEQIQIMYGIRGERHLIEWEVPWLAGYENSSPVRIGNAAAEQLQLDIYGEMMDAFFYALHGVKKQRPQDFHLQTAMINHLCTIWQKPDQGIWESRSGPQQFTYSKVMVWVAFDRAIRIAETLGNKATGEAPVEHWRAIRQKVHDEVCTKAYNQELGAFTQTYDSDLLDSSLLLMPLVGFLPAQDPRVRGTIEAIEKNLMRDGLLMRYDTSKSPDGLPPGEGMFLACSFWMVSCLKLIGREADARKLFEYLLTLRNDVGLLSEEYDVSRKRLVGNFPQAFSHIALVNAAFELEKAEHEVHHRRNARLSPLAPQPPAAGVGESTSELDPHPIPNSPK